MIQRSMVHRVRWPWALLLLAASATGCHRDPPEHPNVVLIVVDTLRADHVSAYGGNVPTPAMDGIARRGARFEQAYAHAPMTGPSHGSMFTGLLPRQHGLLVNGRPLPGRHRVLAEVLRAGGYRTAGFVSLMVLAGKYGFDRGFQTYDDTYGGGWWRTADEVNAEALPWLRERKADGEPFFLFVHYSDPHEPYLPPSRYPQVRLRMAGSTVTELAADGSPQIITLPLQPGDNVLEVIRADDAPWPLRIKKLKAVEGNATTQLGEGFRGNKLRPDRELGKVTVTLEREKATEARFRIVIRPVLPGQDKRRFYAEEVVHVDEAIGELLDALDEQELTDRTLILLTSDHGEELGAREGFFGHVHNLYDELIRVPWLMSLPRRIPAGTVVQFPVRHVDLAPTVLHLTGMAALPEVEGRSAWPPSKIGDRLVFAETHRPQARADKWAVRFEGHKVIENVTSGERRIYDLRLSPNERKTLGELARERAADALRSRPRTNGKRHELSDEEREALRALGYAE